MTKKHVPTDEQRKLVKDLTGYGFIQADICSYIGISDETLRLHYREEIDHGAIEMNALVMDNAFSKACDPDPRNNSMTIFWLKTRCGWRDKDNVDPAATIAAVLEAMRPMDRKEWDKEHGTPG